MLTTEEYDEVKERIEIIARLELVGQSVADAILNMTQAESQAARRVIRERGGGWPRASGHLPIIGHGLKLTGDIRAFFTEQYLKHGPVFEVNVPGSAFVVTAGQEANLFVIREGKSHLRTREVWEGFKDSVGAATLLIGMDGTDHRLLRRTKRNGYSREFILARMTEAVAVVERDLAELPLDRPVSVVYMMQRMMTEQISLLSAGTSSREYIDDIITFNNAMLMVFIAHRYLKFMMRAPWVNRAHRRLELLIERVLNEHELKPDTGEPRDLVDDLLELHRSTPDFLADTDMFIAAMGPFMVGLDTVASTTAFAIYALLKHPGPQRFDIDRYSPERRENVQPGAFVPFGLGHHSCLGQGFAEVQMILTLATLLHRADIALARPGYQLKVQQAPVPRPAGNFKIRLPRRR